MIFELEKIGAKPAVGGHSIFIYFDNDSEVPNIIRVAASVADVMEAKPMNISIDDIYARFHDGGK